MIKFNIIVIRFKDNDFINTFAPMARVLGGKFQFSPEKVSKELVSSFIKEGAFAFYTAFQRGGIPHVSEDFEASERLTIQSIVNKTEIFVGKEALDWFMHNLLEDQNNATLMVTISTTEPPRIDYL